MHRNVLSTRLESQEGRDRLKCLAIYVHQKNKQWQLDEGWSTKHLRFTGAWIPRTEGIKRTMTLYNQKHRGILTSVQQLKLEELHLCWYSLLFFKFLHLTPKLPETKFFSRQVFKKFLHLKTTFVFRWS